MTVSLLARVHVHRVPFEKLCSGLFWLTSVMVALVIVVTSLYEGATLFKNIMHTHTLTLMTTHPMHKYYTTLLGGGGGNRQ